MRRLPRSLALIALSAFVTPGILNGQASLDPDLLARCQAVGLPIEGQALCQDVIIAAQLVQPELGLALAGGNPVLGTASPIGTKFRFIPRVYLGGRMNFVWGEIPDILNYPENPTEPAGTVGFSVTMIQLDASVGVFDGFKLGATTGGLASVELLGSLGTMILPAGAGFENDVAGFGLGARIGLLRESFTAPGISFSGEYQWTGRIRYGDVRQGDDAQFGLDLDVASFRAGISKSFVAIGLAFTLGWDHYTSDVDFGVADADGDLVAIVPEGAPIGLSSDRWSAFFDISYIVLFFNIAAELGWQETETLVTSRGDDLESGNFFGAIGIRFSL